MNLKEKLLMFLEENRGGYFSGEKIATDFDVSRTAVWKAVNTLRKEGYEIQAITNKGYCLPIKTDIVSLYGVKKYLNDDCNFLDIKVLDEVESTNNMLREAAESGSHEEHAIIANSQTKGKGRVGRKFYSPADTGIYLSILLRPKNVNSMEASKITTIAAVAACEAIETMTDEIASIKWVNDIFMRNKKVAGILTEASFSLESGCIDYIILGIGINVYKPKEGFANEIKEIATSIFDCEQNDGKNRLVAEFLNRFMGYYSSFTDKDADINYIKKYRERSFVIGRNIKVIKSDKLINAKVIDIDDECHLKVEYEDGAIEYLSSGEISIKV